MGLMKDVYEAEQAKIAADRAKRHEDNLKRMAEDAKLRPEPSIADVRAATGLPPRDEDVEKAKVEPAPATEPAHVETKTSEPEPASGGQYKTREARPANSRK